MKMVTRTVATTTVTITVVNKTTKVMETFPVAVTGDVTNEKPDNLEKKLKKAIGPAFVLVSVDDMMVTEEIYGMSIEEFMELAHPVQRGKKEENE